MTNGSLAGHTTLIDRVKGILLKPKEEWPRIEAETASQADILKSYVLPLAAITPVAVLLGSLVFGRSFLFVTTRPSLTGALGTAVFSYILAIVAVFILALIANWLAPKFNGQANPLNAFKLVAYGATAAWVAGVFNLIPALSLFTLLGLYSIYLFYTGAAPMMKVPEDKLIGYTAVTFLCAIVLNLLVTMVAGAIIGLFGLGGAAAGLGGGSSEDEVEINIPGVGSINTRKMEEAAQRMEKIQKGEITALPAETLRTFLPDSIGDFTRTAVSSQAMGQAGTGVEGTYKSGDYQFDLRINDVLGMGGIAGLGSAMGIETSREDENGYQRLGTVDGQWRNEEWNISAERGTYHVLVAERFNVEAKGKVPSIDVLKRAVAAVDQKKLEGLAE